VANYDAVDLEWSDDGDLIIEDNGDLSDTGDDHILSVVQELVGVMRNEPGDFAEYPTITASLFEFIGEPNTRENAKKMEEKIKTRISNALPVNKQDLQVRVNAAGMHSVFIELILSAEPTTNNTLRGPLTLTLFFDSTDGNLLWAHTDPGVI